MGRIKADRLADRHMAGVGACADGNPGHGGEDLGCCKHAAAQVAKALGDGVALGIRAVHYKAASRKIVGR